MVLRELDGLRHRSRGLNVRLVHSDRSARVAACRYDQDVSAPFARTLLGDLQLPSDRPLAASTKAAVWLGVGATFEGL